MLELLREQPRPVGELVTQLGLTQPGTSKHLRVLREAGLVRVRTEAQRRVYAVDPGPLAEIDGWERTLNPKGRKSKLKEDDKKNIQRTVKELKAKVKAMTDTLEQSPDELKQTLSRVLATIGGP